jgi:hypothetical protein
MSKEQKEAIAKIFHQVGLWLTRGVLVANVWILTEVYRDFKADFKEIKADVQTLKQNDRANTVSIEFLKDQIKARR